nr:hypothetical protein [Candidatus Njordarchaeota archaeon]
MGTGKAVYTTFKVLAVIFSLTATASGALLALDMTKINVSPPTSSSVQFDYSIGPPAQLNISFPLTITYGGSVCTINSVNLTLAIYGDAGGLGTPLFVNTTIFTLAPQTTMTINYNFSKTNPPLITHLSIRAIVKGVISEVGISFMGFGLDMLYTIF